MAPSKIASPWLNTAAAAKYLHRGQRFVLREIHAGRLRAAQVGGRNEILTRPEWLDEWVANQAPVVPLARRERTG